MYRPLRPGGGQPEAGDYDSQRDLYPSGVIKGKIEMKIYSALLLAGTALFFTHPALATVCR
ncbi:hypothetical protein CC624_07585, partial [Salmonella enterica subsp. enterica serovar Wangata]|nr:hypothetical protein [Salmonella enterica subsp. enterica serovar Wangata]